MNQFFVTGTDTDVGKTIVSAFLVNKLSASYWKPVQSGLSDGTDKATVQSITGLKDEQIIPSVYEFDAPLSPHEAARLEDRTIDFDKITRPEHNGPLIVEGAGGLMVPLNDEYLIIDLIKKLGYPVILVSRSTLGTINHTLLSLMALHQQSIEVAGVIMNGPENPKNKEAIEFYGETKVIAEIPILDSLKIREFERLNLNLNVG